ncbi:glycoside hydrolase family 71/99-like protein [Ferruginibacter sp. SUN002]|uniref:glycoside hydrolase family 71/99-like protein n=1 Tax=Ferruginibacter sp. SUN002 TaxID=2937789 RepID=UPI003D36A32B
MSYIRKLSLLVSFCYVCMSVQSQIAPVAQTIVGKTICGYQGWFSCYGDGSPVARWFHWSNGTYQSNAGAPAPGAIKFEAYPAIDEYNAGSLFQTNLGNFGDGSSAKLFSSYKADVIETHFRWMKQHEIDGVALQRFISETFDGVFKLNRDSITARVKRSAEANQRVFYLMYDISGLDATKFDSLKTDWQNNMIAKLNITSSPYYLHQGGKPVVCIWGLGFTDRQGDATQSLDVINWFKANGCYVVGGVPTNWRTSSGDSKAGFTNVYNQYDMISPWSVGRFADSIGTDNFKTNYLIPDLAYCNSNNILYQPVVFPGFAWSNWNGGSKNQIPRNKGEFMWRQVYNIKQSGIGNMYVAMFDEYDEGTAITKMADSYYSIPTNQYFLTTSADGTYLSSDFYMRLTGKATKAIRDEEPITKYVTIPYSVGPMWFRTSFEKTFDAAPNWTDSQEPSIPAVNIGGIGGGGNPECGVVTGEITQHIGTNAIRFSGRDNSATSSYIYFRTFSVNIPVDLNTDLSFWTYPQQNLSRYVSIDLLLSDGTRLQDYPAIDTNGLSMHPSTPRGTLNTWNKTTSHIGTWLNGKTITKIMIAYDHPAETGDFRGYVDDISIYQANSTVYTFIGNGNWNVPSNWLNNNMPPADLTGGIIYIDPVIEGECILNITQHLRDGNKLIVNPNKKFRLTERLEIKN